MMEKVDIKKVDLDKNFQSKRMDKDLMNLISSLKISYDDAKKCLSSLEDCVLELNNCKNCKNYLDCPNHIKGYVYYPKMDESKVTFNYIPCKKLKKFEEDKAKMEASYLLENARMKDIDTSDANRKDLIMWITKFYKEYDPLKENKGLYLHGSFGSGKTYLLCALLNELRIKKNVNSEVVYFPDLLRNLKDDFNTLDSKVKYYSNVEILLLDDIGAEKVTDWSRDEVLGSILQNRMNNHLTTFFTSNLNLEELEKHLSISKDSVDKVKGRRIIERVKQLTADLEVVASNRRN